MIPQIIVTLCVLCCLGQTQNSYDSKQHSNVTLTWIFPPNVDMQPQQLVSHIFHEKTQKRIYLCDSRHGREFYPDELYRGRLHCHPQLFHKGRMDCILTNLSLSDAGTYECILGFDRKTESSQQCYLNVTEVSKPEKEPLRPTSRERTACYVVVVLFLVVTAALCVWTLRRKNIISNSSI